MTAIFDSTSEPIARRVTAGLAKVSQVLRTRAWKGAGADGVTPTQGHALGLLRDVPGGMRLNALSRMLGVSPPTASDMTNALVAKGLVAKQAGPDRRSIALVLTPAGETLADRAREWPGFLADAVDTLEEDEKAGFLRALVKVIRALQVSGDVSQQRMCVTCNYFRPYAHADRRNPHHCAYVDAPFGDRHLRLACPEHEEAPLAFREATWSRFASGGWVDGHGTPAT